MAGHEPRRAGVAAVEGTGPARDADADEPAALGAQDGEPARIQADEQGITGAE